VTTTSDSTAPRAVSEPDAAAGRQLRTDARANRQRLLRAAAEVFTAEGVAAPISEVARRAGVGMGTVYRHFPTKEALFEAIVEEHCVSLLATAEALRDSPDPGKAFDEFLDSFSAAVSTKRCLADALERTGIDIKARLSELIGELQVHVSLLLSRAQAEGTVRADLNTPDVFALVHAACVAADHQGGDPATTARMLRLVRDGFRP
jgi:AcrR family transcriptional regulator